MVSQFLVALSSPSDTGILHNTVERSDRSMTTFLIGLALLFVGGALYSAFVTRVCKPDDRPAPLL